MLPNIRKKYADAFPDLALKIIEFFHIGAASGPSGGSPKRVLDFIQTLPVDTPVGTPQPGPINEFCELLCSAGELTAAGVDQNINFMGLGNRYYSGGVLQQDPLILVWKNQYYGAIIFGFPWIYNYYTKSIIPIEHTSSISSRKSLGTSFIISNRCLLTASHCVTGAAALSVQGVAPEVVAAASIYISKSEMVDLALIEFEQPIFNDMPFIMPSEPSILDEVMAMGFPNVSGFIPSLAAERAAVSSNLTAVRGTVASTPTEIWAREPLLLITARVRGGFSGGPVLNDRGQYVGLVSRGAHNEVVLDADSAAQQYDNLGYGTVIPQTMIQSFINDINRKAFDLAKKLDTAKIEYSIFF